MDARELIEVIQRDAIDYPYKQLLKQLLQPKSTIPMEAWTSEVDKSVGMSLHARAEIEERRARWFHDLDDNGREFVKELLQECAELSAVMFLNVLDGIGSYEGSFKLVAMDAKGNRTVVNPENSEMLHDVFYDVMAESERAANDGDLQS
ncbi:MAG: hypothetical protein HOQ35_08605 [Acidobacteriaceae bacterium]|nr:hypothetical protein [Acidobacteriaceae bacterium]